MSRNHFDPTTIFAIGSHIFSISSNSSLNSGCVPWSRPLMPTYRRLRDCAVVVLPNPVTLRRSAPVVVRPSLAVTFFETYDRWLPASRRKRNFSLPLGPWGLTMAVFSMKAPPVGVSVVIVDVVYVVDPQPALLSSIEDSSRAAHYGFPHIFDISGRFYSPSHNAASWNRRCTGLALV